MQVRLRRPARGYLHVFQEVAIYQSATSSSAKIRLAHLRTARPVTDTSVEPTWEVFVQPPSVRDTNGAGIVTATYDAAREGFHLIYAGGNRADPIPDYSHVFPGLTRDPYTDHYRETSTNYAFLPDGEDFITRRTVLFQGAPVVYDTVDELQRKDDDGFLSLSGARVALYRFRKYPMLALRSPDELVLSAVANASACHRLTDGDVCKWVNPATGLEGSVDRPTGQAHFNLLWDVFSIGSDGTLTHREGGSAKPTYRLRDGIVVPGEDLTCRRQYDNFDMAPDEAGNIFFATVETTHPVAGWSSCTRTAKRGISALTRSNAFFRDTLSLSWRDNTLVGSPCLSSAASRLFWFLPGNGSETLGAYYEIGGTPTAPVLFTPPNSTIALPPNIRHARFPACLNARTLPERPTRLLFLTTAADVSLGQVPSPGEKGTTIWAIEAPENVPQ